jgi:hypothetical protein
VSLNLLLIVDLIAPATSRQAETNPITASSSFFSWCLNRAGGAPNHHHGDLPHLRPSRPHRRFRRCWTSPCHSERTIVLLVSHTTSWTSAPFRSRRQPLHRRSPPFFFVGARRWAVSDNPWSIESLSSLPMIFCNVRVIFPVLAQPSPSRLSSTYRAWRAPAASSLLLASSLISFS